MPVRKVLRRGTGGRGRWVGDVRCGRVAVGSGGGGGGGGGGVDGEDCRRTLRTSNGLPMMMPMAPER